MRAPLDPERAGCEDSLIENSAPLPHRFVPQFAALDLGTNNCRLLIARPTGGGFRVVDAFSRIVRLGEGLAATGALSEEAMQRALDALQSLRRKISARRVAAGALCCHRSVPPRRQLRGLPRPSGGEIGLEIEIISSIEEARLVVAGCGPLLHPRIPYAIVFDIGGGSTEIVWLRLSRGPGGRRRPHILGSISLPFGVVTLTDRFGGTEVSPATYRAMVAEATAALVPFERSHHILRHIRVGSVQMLGSSGTVTTLAGIHLALPRYTRALVDGSMLTFEQIAARVRPSRRSRLRRARRQSLHRPRARRSGAERLRDPRRDLRDLAGGPAARRRPGRARGHSPRSDAG